MKKRRAYLRDVIHLLVSELKTAQEARLRPTFIEVEVIAQETKLRELRNILSAVMC